jgi:hypothetical protein
MQCIGSAVHTAYTLGLHDEEFARVENENAHLELRPHLMRSMFVLDRLFSEFLGLPIVMRESTDMAQLRPEPDMRHDGIISTRQLALDAVVQASWAMNQLIKNYREKGLITTSFGLEIWGKCMERSGALSPALKFSRCVQEGQDLSLGDRIAILHVNVLEAHCRLLTTRPFFFVVFVDLLRSHRAMSTGDFRPLASLAQSCFETSISVVSMIHLAYRSKWLPPRHGFIL